MMDFIDASFLYSCSVPFLDLSWLNKAHKQSGLISEHAHMVTFSLVICCRFVEIMFEYTLFFFVAMAALQQNISSEALCEI